MELPSDVNNFKIAQNLKASEVMCPSTKTLMATPRLLRAWERLRKKVDRPINVNSGYRTPKYHEELYKRKYGKNWKEHFTPDSKHLTGEALDLKVPRGMETEKFMEIAMDSGFTYVYNITDKKLSGDVHCDVRRG